MSRVQEIRIAFSKLGVNSNANQILRELSGEIVSSDIASISHIKQELKRIQSATVQENMDITRILRSSGIDYIRLLDRWKGLL